MKAPLSDPLSKLRLICGRQFMTFVDRTFSSPKECTDAGGRWGERLKVFSDEDDYIRLSR
jgi:hypothetical protein